MPTSTTFVSSSLPLAAGTTALTDGVLPLRYAVAGGVASFDCCGQRATSGGTIHLAPETWRAWLFQGIDLAVEPAAAAPTLLVRLTDERGGALLTTDGEPTPVSAPVRLRAHLLFADLTGMTFKIALDGAGAVHVVLAEFGSKLRPPPPKLPPDPPQPN
jgi:hypothetical protein